MPVFDIIPPKRKLTDIAKSQKKNKQGKKEEKNFPGNRIKKPLKGFLIGSVVIGFLLFVFFSLRSVVAEKELTKNFYSTRCEGEWYSAGRAAGLPDVSLEGDISFFSERNSAVYRFGSQELMCKWFDELPEIKSSKAKDFCKKDNQDCQVSSAKVFLSFAIDDLENKDNLNLSESSEKESAFDFLSKKTSNQEEGHDITLDIDTKIVLWYSLDHGKTWNSFGKISAFPFSNQLNKGYLSFHAPFVKDWEDLDNLRIMAEGVIGSDENIVAFVDSVWVEVVAKEKLKIFEEIKRKSSEKIFSMFEKEDKVPEKLENIQKEFEYQIPSDGKIVARIDNSNRSVDGIFRVYFFSQKGQVLATLVLMGGKMADFQGYDVSEPKAGNFLYNNFLESQEAKTTEVEVKKNWEKIKIKITYIPLGGKENIGLDNLELEFVPGSVLAGKAEFLEEVSFEADEQGEKEVKINNQKKGTLIIDILESGLGGSALLFLAEDQIFKIVELRDNLKFITSIKDVPAGLEKIKVKQVDTKEGWKDNKNPRVIKLYFQEEE